ncbi:hypothetical protein PG993_008276 [Apiospora rasikravindrae]|uniref:Uncharacterized protein n=1 Tax=Apiospora rasikravindrae TaxID=990691 RepID=A0ABR1SZW9_9PEZI
MGFLVLDQDYQSQAQAKIRASRSPDGVQRGNLRCEITLPLLTNPPENRLACYETAQETAYVSAHISSRIHALYSQLAAHAAATSPSTPAVAPEGIALDIEVAPQSFDIYPECDHRRDLWRGLRLVRHPPLVPARPLAMSRRPAAGHHASTSVDVGEAHALRLARPWEGPLRDARHEFGHAISEPDKFLRGRRIPASLKHALLHFWEPAQIAMEDQRVARPDLVHPAARDPVSVGLCSLAVQLQRLDLRALVTEDLFPAAEDQQWSAMQRLRVEFHPLRPDGMWYFVGPRGEDPLRSGGSEEGEREGGFQISETADYPREHDTAADKEMDEEYDEFPNGDSELDHLPDMFRTEPHRQRIEPLLGRFAAAVANMPRLEDAEIFAHVWWTPSESREEGYAGDAPYDQDSVHRWGVRYIAGRGGDGDGKATTPVVQWQVGDWRPSIGVMALFEALGTQEWLDWEFTEGRPWPTTEDAMRARLF